MVKEIISFKKIKDIERGGILSCFNILPFKPVRMFWVKDIPAGGVRGGHAHKKCKQFYICLQGQIDIRHSVKNRLKTITLNQDEACFIDAGVWTKETFIQANSFLMVLCSEPYDPEDYIYEME